MAIGHFSWEDLGYRVEADDPAHLRWLREFLAPHFGTRDDAPETVEVRLAVDERRFALHRSTMALATPVAAFLADSEVVRLPAVRTAGDALVLGNERGDVFFEVSADRRQVTIVAERRETEARKDLMRVLREYAMNRGPARGGFFLHASCIRSSAQPLVVTGPRSAGKTTLLMFGCLLGGARFLTNDRVLVRRRAGRYHLRGMPTVVTIRRKGLSLFPAAHQRLLEQRLDYRMAGSGLRAAPGQTAQPDADGKHRLTSAQLRRLLGVGQISRAADPVVIVPRITRQPGRFSLSPLTPDEAAALLQDSLFGARHWATATPIFTLDAAAAPTAAAVQERCRLFVEEVPCLLCELGEDLYAGPGNAAAWLRAVAKSSAGWRR
jgi:hypothetical protein